LPSWPFTMYGQEGAARSQCYRTTVSILIFTKKIVVMANARNTPTGFSGSARRLRTTQLPCLTRWHGACVPRNFRADGAVKLARFLRRVSGPTPPAWHDSCAVGPGYRGLSLGRAGSKAPRATELRLVSPRPPIVGGGEMPRVVRGKKISQWYNC